MTITMNDSRIININQVEEIIKVVDKNKENNIEFACHSRKERYAWIEQTLGKFGYFSLRKKEKVVVKKYLLSMTGMSDAQITRLIQKKKDCGKIFSNQSRRNKFATVYTVEDVALLIQTDNAHGRLSGPATKRIFQREHRIFSKNQYIRLQNISSSHIYNLRGKRQYLSNTVFWQKTKPTPVNIGQREKPQPAGKPGFIRVDTVHQGDRDKEKGVYHVNFVDEVTQWELIGCVEKISEYFLEPLLEKLIQQFPFRIINFHSDNGSEFINQIVARLLNKLLIKQTKSRARHCNDNALAESKNGSVIRKHLGRNFIAQCHAPLINDFYENYFNQYLNFHRPSGFATETTDARGKIRKKYDNYLTPYEKLKSLEKFETYLKPEVKLADLERVAHEKSDNEFAALMQKAKVELFKTINHKSQLPTAFSVPNLRLIS